MGLNIQFAEIALCSWLRRVGLPKLVSCTGRNDPQYICAIAM